MEIWSYIFALCFFTVYIKCSTFPTVGVIQKNGMKYFQSGLKHARTNETQNIAKRTAAVRNIVTQLHLCYRYRESTRKMLLHKKETLINFLSL